MNVRLELRLPIEHRTLNIQRPAYLPSRWMLEVECWLLDVDKKSRSPRMKLRRPSGV